MNFSLPTDPHELEWLTQVAIDAHCQVNSSARFSLGHGVWCNSAVSLLLGETKSASLKKYSGTLLPLLGALSALDQYGACYSPETVIFPTEYSKKSGIIKSAHNFLNIPVNSRDSDALYAIRNSLMHQSSLISVDIVKNVKNFWFEINNKIGGIFSHATIPWDGVYSSRCEENRTLVNSEKILGLAYKLVKTLIKDHQEGKLRLALGGGLEELLSNYVHLEFSVSRRDSYIKYIATKIYEEISCQPAGAKLAKEALSSVPQSVRDEAALWLISEEGGLDLERVARFYPSVKVVP